MATRLTTPMVLANMLDNAPNLRFLPTDSATIFFSFIDKVLLFSVVGRIPTKIFYVNEILILAAKFGARRQ
jgi:hypothetical protein